MSSWPNHLQSPGVPSHTQVREPQSAMRHQEQPQSAMRHQEQPLVQGLWSPRSAMEVMNQSGQPRKSGKRRPMWPAPLTGKVWLWKKSLVLVQQNRNFRPKDEGRSGRRPLLPKRKLNILVDLTLRKSYHSVVTFLHAQEIKCYTFSIQTSSKLISYYVCPWKVGP